MEDNTICVMGPSLTHFLSKVQLLQRTMALHSGYAYYKTLKNVLSIYLMINKLETRVSIYPDQHLTSSFGGDIPAWNYITTMSGNDVVKHKIANVDVENTYRVCINIEKAIKLGLTNDCNTYDMIGIDDYSCFDLSLVDQLIEYNCRPVDNLDSVNEYLEQLKIELEMTEKIKEDLILAREKFVFVNGVLKTSPIMRPKSFPKVQ